MITKQEDFIRKLIREELNNLNEDFSKQFINDLSNDIVNNTDALEQGAWIDYDEPKSKSIQSAKKFIKNIFNTDFNNGGLKNIPNTFILYRVVFLDDENKLNTKFLGKHWVRNEKLIKDHISSIMSQFNMTDEEFAYIIIAKFKKDDIDIYHTVYNNVSVDHEEEVTIKDGINPIGYEIKKL